MRCLLKMEMDTEAGNRAIRDGSMPQLLQELMEKTKPEATYFATQDGRRTAFIFFDLKDPSDTPPIAELGFQNLNAKVTFTPVMNMDDLQKGLAQIL